MERLKEAQFEFGSLEAEARDLLRGAEPHGVPASLKRNVRVRLVEASLPCRRAPLWLRGAVVAGVLAVVTVAVAAVGHFVRNPARAALASRSIGGVGAPRPSAPLGGPGNAPAASSAEVSTPSASAVAISIKHDSLDVHADAHHDSALDAHADAQHDSARDNAPVSEASLVYETARVLRNEGDPARAARVLDDYFKRYPHGALAEEAQALAIDIAVARGSAHAKSLAARYLSVYPNGHFRAKAEHVLDAD